MPKPQRSMDTAYLAGVRDTIRAMIKCGAADAWEVDDARELAGLLRVPYLFVKILEEERYDTGASVRPGDLDELSQWLEEQEATRDALLGVA